MAEMLTYAPDLRSITGGQGDYTLEFLRYEEVPGHLAQKVVEQATERARHATPEAVGQRRVTTSPRPGYAQAAWPPARSSPPSPTSPASCARARLLRGEQHEIFLAGGPAPHRLRAVRPARRARGLAARGDRCGERDRRRAPAALGRLIADRPGAGGGSSSACGWARARRRARPRAEELAGLVRRGARRRTSRSAAPAGAGRSTTRFPLRGGRGVRRTSAQEPASAAPAGRGRSSGARRRGRSTRASTRAGWPALRARSVRPTCASARPSISTAPSRSWSPGSSAGIATRSIHDRRAAHQTRPLEQGTELAQLVARGATRQRARWPPTARSSLLAAAVAGRCERRLRGLRAAARELTSGPR